MTEYSVITNRFNDEFLNGSSFSTNPTTVYSVNLKGNVGDRIKLTQTIEISVTVNKDENQTIQYNATSDATYGEFVATGLNWLNEGIYTGAVCDVTWGGGAAVSVTAGLITGAGFTTLKITKANLTAAGIIDGDIRQDFKIRLTSVPDTLIYKYGLNANGYTGTAYTSWFDSNTQGYYLSNITGSLQSMTRIGLGVKSWDLSESVQAKYDATVSTYKFQYTVEHIFKIPFYVDGEYDNIYQQTSPSRFNGTASVTYDNGWFFGGTTLGEYIKAEVKGGIGNVGYFYENFNGYNSNFEIQNVSISNSDNSGVLEGTVANTVTCQVKNNFGNWSAGTSKLIIKHAKLPTQSEYQNKTATFGTIWIYDQVQQVEGAAAGTGTAVISNCTVTINADPTLLDVSFVVTYDTSEQLLISDSSDYLIWLTAGNDPTVADDRVALPIDINQFSKNLDIPGLITGVDVEFFEPFEFSSGTRRLSSWTGWDGDLGGVEATVTKSASGNYVISKAQFRIISTDGTDEIDLLTVDFPIGKPQTTTAGGYVYQLIKLEAPAGFNLPEDDELNIIYGYGVKPVTPVSTQALTFRVGFQTPWRDWIKNLTVPNSFFDPAEPQEGQHYKTSAYSNVNGFEVFPIWEFTVRSSAGVETIYRKLTFESNVYDFDTNGSTFSATTKFYDEDGNETDNIYEDQNVRVEMSFAHSLGTITKANIEGYVWIERNGSVVQPYFLHTSKDWTRPDNPLQPTDTLGTGNTQYVEVVSSNNLIKLIFQTNRDNLQDGVTYNIYGRIKNNTIA